MTMATLGDLVELQRGYDLPESVRRPGSVPVIGSAGLTGFHDIAKVRGPGVTLGRSGASFGKVTYVQEDFWPHNACLFVKDFKGNDVRFVAYLLESIDFSSMNSGSAQQSLNRNYLYSIAAARPSIAVQRRIAGILSGYDDLIENCERRIRVLDEMARALFREWFVDFRYPGHEKVPLVASSIGRIPMGWRVMAASEAMGVNPKISLPRDGARPFVPMTSLTNDTMLIRGIESRSATFGAKFQNGDTLLARITPCLENGKTAFVQFLADDSHAACGSTEFIVFRGSVVPGQFVYCLARSGEFRAHAIKSMTGATGRQRVQEGCFKQYFLPIAPELLLKEFAERTGPSFKLTQALHQRIENLRKTRDLLLPRLISGQLSVAEAA
jgi:type I restriction enzyme S subunit